MNIFGRLIQRLLKPKKSDQPTEIGNRSVNIVSPTNVEKGEVTESISNLSDLDNYILEIINSRETTTKMTSAIIDLLKSGLELKDLLIELKRLGISATDAQIKSELNNLSIEYKSILSNYRKNKNNKSNFIDAVRNFKDDYESSGWSSEIEKTKSEGGLDKPQNSNPNRLSSKDTSKMDGILGKYFKGEWITKFKNAITKIISSPKIIGKIFSKAGLKVLMRAAGTVPGIGTAISGALGLIGTAISFLKGDKHKATSELIGTAISLIPGFGLVASIPAEFLALEMLDAMDPDDKYAKERKDREDSFLVDEDGELNDEEDMADTETGEHAGEDIEENNDNSGDELVDDINTTLENIDNVSSYNPDLKEFYNEIQYPIPINRFGHNINANTNNPSINKKESMGGSSKVQFNSVDALPKEVKKYNTNDDNISSNNLTKVDNINPKHINTSDQGDIIQNQPISTTYDSDLTNQDDIINNDSNQTYSESPNHTTISTKNNNINKLHTPDRLSSKVHHVTLLPNSIDNSESDLVIKPIINLNEIDYNNIIPSNSIIKDVGTPSFTKKSINEINLGFTKMDRSVKTNILINANLIGTSENTIINNKINNE